MTFDGQCLCGNVRYRVTGQARGPCFCHCESCRRAAGAPFVAWATFDRERFEVVQGELAEIASSEHVSRGFCKDCGTSLTYFNEVRPGDVDVTLASFDAPGAVAPEAHIWLEDKLPWIQIDDGLPQYDRFRTAATGSPP